VLPDGRKASNGYEALAALDSNGDGVIDARDEAFGKLQVWVDGNADGMSQKDELKSLKEAGIAGISVQATEVSGKDNGNWIGLSSSYETTDGRQQATVDVWFVAEKPADMRGKVGGMVQAMAAFAEGQGGAGAQLPTLENARTNGIPAAMTVGGMVDTLRHYDANGNLIAAGSGASTDQPLGLDALRNPGNNGILANGK
jgi:hypothetical protein